MSDDFVSDREMLQRLNLPPKVGKPAIEVLTRRDPNFPKPDPLFGGKRFWPAVVAWFHARYGVKPGVLPVVDGEENFNEPTENRRRARTPLA